MSEFGKKDKESLDAEIRAELEKIRTLREEELKRVYGGKHITHSFGDTREEYSMNPEEINRSIYGALYD